MLFYIDKPTNVLTESESREHGQDKEQWLEVWKQDKK